MKKTLGILLVALLSFALLAGCAKTPPGGDVPQATPAPQASDPAEPSGEPGIYDDIEPLETPTDLSIGYLTGSHHGMISFMIEELGGFEKAGITPTIQVFGNGPVMVEATDAWDCGTYGLGGTLTGVISQGHYVIGAAARDYSTLQIFARNGSPVEQAGQTVSDTPGLYGTAETWKDAEVFVPTGTTLHYILATGLEKLGLKDSDVKMTHMDVPSVNTALQANQGDIGALWGSFSLDPSITDNFVPAMTAKDLGIELQTVMVANPESYDDPVQYAAIEKWMELYFATVDWIYANDDNFSQAVQMFTAINDEQGVKSTVEQNAAILENDSHYTLQENYDLFNTMDDEDKMSLMEKANYDPLLFFISTGNYQSEDADTFLDGYFKSDIVDNLHGK